MKKNQTLKEMMATLLISSVLPRNLCGEAILQQNGTTKSVVCTQRKQ